MFDITLLWKQPELNPINHKAKSIPLLNPFSIHGRVFFFSWFGFMVAFWSWYAFPPLLHDIIAEDLDLTDDEVSNSNIIALIATLLVRFAAGPSCDAIGPRWTFAATLLVGAIPTFLAGTAYNVHQLYALRFFIGILGGSFVPVQVWSTAFFDKNIVGTANALTGGFGNSGGGITYFAMPAIYASLHNQQGLSQSVAWRVAFVVPGIMIVSTTIAMLLLCPDTPTGKWSERFNAAEENARQLSNNTNNDGSVVAIPGQVSEDNKPQLPRGTSDTSMGKEEKKAEEDSNSDIEAQVGQQQNVSPNDAAMKGEVIQKPTFKQVALLTISPQSLVLAAVYFCTFGAELSFNSVLGSYYAQQFPDNSRQTNGNWAAMFGLMNVLWRPLGGVAGDLVYKYSGHRVWSKKIAMHIYGAGTGAMLLLIGLINPTDLPSMVCLVAIGLAFFNAGGNGVVFSLVPHVHPHANGVVSGLTGAAGNLGGVVFAIVFRYNDYAQAIWIIGAMCVAINVLICWIQPIPKGQVGGR